MLNFCMRGASRAAGLAILSFCLGILTGRFLPVVWVAAIELSILVFFGYMCLFKW